jgi:SagB-type dehydrogenase family enzyme
LSSTNYEIQEALKYHEETKHSEISVRFGGHLLDLANKPCPFKIYKNSPKVVPLPRDFPHPNLNTLDAIERAKEPTTSRIPDIRLLAEVLFFASGLTRKLMLHGEEYYMRAASATGALYPIELYVVSQEISGLEAGVYHFDPLKFALNGLRIGDHRGTLSLLGGEDESIRLAPFTVVFTSLAWRNAWKYEARSFRHWFWDSGVICANLIATCAAEGLKTKLVMGFLDKEVDKLLGLKKNEEAVISLAPVGIGLSGETKSLENLAVSPLTFDYVPLSQHLENYPLIWNINDASSLYSLEEVKAWKAKIRNIFQKTFSDQQLGKCTISVGTLGAGRRALSLGETILRRGSTRRFARKSIPLKKLVQILLCARTGVSFDSAIGTISDIYLIANDIEGLPAGSYFFDSQRNSLVQLKLGNFRNMSSYLCLGQPLFGDASAVLFLMCDLNRILKELGNRGYRMAQFESGITAGKIYLSAYSLELGASGSTFYDDAVTEFFSPHAENKNTMIAVGVGLPDYKTRSGRVLFGN